MSKEYNLPDINPLNAGHLEDINKALSAIDVGLKQADLASRVGLDVTPYIDHFHEMQKKLEAIKQVYFPAQ